MTSARLESFSDGVMAILITIAVLGIEVPSDATLDSLMRLIPVFLIYAASFQTIGTYWNNHHYLFKVVKEVDARILWANLLLLFCLSLIPFSMQWLGEHILQRWPTVMYCAVLLAAALAYGLLSRAIALRERRVLHVTSLIEDGTGRRWVSVFLYVAAVLAAFWHPLVSYALIIAVGAMWFLPDRQFDRIFNWNASAA